MADTEMKKAKAGALLGGALALALAVPALVAVAAPTSNTTVSAGNDLRLASVVEIPYETQIVEDSDLPADVEVEKEPGSSGLKYVYTSSYSETEAPQVVSRVVKEATDRVIHRGTKVELPSATEPEPEPEPEPIDTSSDPEGASRASVNSNLTTTGQYGLRDLQFQGVIMWGGYKFTYYSQQVLPGGGLRIPGRHVNGSGFVSDGDGYIVLAGSAPMGTVYATPFGAPGKIYDRGTSGNHLDVYTQ